MGKRLRQLRRITLIFAGCVATAVAVLALWWVTSLIGLPDIGDPFDVAAFHAFHVPDDQNAFTYIRQRTGKLTPLAELVDRPIPEDPDSHGPPPIRSCGSGPRERRGAQAVFRGRRATGRRARGGRSARNLNPKDLTRLVFLEAHRRKSAETRPVPGNAIARFCGWSVTTGSAEARTCASPPRRRTAHSDDASAIGRRTRGPRSPSFMPRSTKCSRTSPNPIGTSPQSNRAIYGNRTRGAADAAFRRGTEIEGEWGLGGMTFSAATIDHLEAAAPLPFARAQARSRPCSGCFAPATWRTRNRANRRREGRPPRHDFLRGLHEPAHQGNDDRAAVPRRCKPFRRHQCMARKNWRPGSFRRLTSGSDSSRRRTAPTGPGRRNVL